MSWPPRRSRARIAPGLDTLTGEKTGRTLMGLDGALFTLAVLGLALSPLLAYAWTRALRTRRLTRPLRAAGVVVLSLATLAVVCVLPLIVLARVHGVEAGGKDLDTIATMALFCIPGIIAQVVAALGFALNDGSEASRSR